MAKKKDKKKDKAKVKDVSEKKKKEKKGRQEYDLQLKDGEFVEKVPADFDFAKHYPLKRKCWATEWQHFEHRANEAEWRCTMLRVKAKRSKELGSAKDRSRMNRLGKMTAKMAELRAELEADGIDVDGLLESVESES